METFDDMEIAFDRSVSKSGCYLLDGHWVLLGIIETMKEVNNVVRYGPHSHAHDETLHLGTLRD
jgi:hypothetical protein